MKLRVSLGLFATVVASAGLVAWRTTRGTITLQIVPEQSGAPVTLESAVWVADDLSQLRITIRNGSDQAVSTRAAAIVVSEPRAERVFELQLSGEPIAAGQSRSEFLGLGLAWPPEPWSRYRRGAILTLGLTSAVLAGNEWTSDVGRSLNRFAPAGVREDRVTATSLIGLVPPWVGRSGVPTMANGPAQYPTNGSLDGGTCTVTRCRAGYCEFNGCTVRQ